MEQSNFTDQVRYELRGLIDSIEQTIGSFSQTQSRVTDPDGRTPGSDSQEMTHHVLDVIDKIKNHSDDIARDLKILRKALPATYFKNRSAVRDAFERMTSNAAANQDSAYAIMDVLQSRRLSSPGSDGRADEFFTGFETKFSRMKELVDKLCAKSGDKAESEDRSFSTKTSFDTTPTR